MKTPYIVSFFVLAATLCHGALVKNEISVRKGVGIDISKNLTINNPDLNSPAKQPCISGQCEQMSDVFFLKVGDWDGSGCGGELLSVISFDTIRELKKTLSADFNGPLDLSDTSRFSYSFVQSYSGCTEWRVSCPYFVNPCFWGSDWTPPTPNYYLAKTAEGNYFLFRYLSRETVGDSTAQGGYEVVTISTILQTDGSLDFRGVSVALTNYVKQRTPRAPKPEWCKRFGSPSGDHCGRGIYDFRGRLISGQFLGVRRLRSASMIYIISK